MRQLCKLFMILFALLVSGALYAEKSTGQTIVLKKPPEILAKWYKPANKRQVWLHTMFRLRREMLAMSMYAQKQQQADLEKWTEKFAKDYKSIAEMVPQWQDYLYLDKLNSLQQSVEKQDYPGIAVLLKKIGKSCMHCHDDYQTVATLLYRTADFNKQSILKTEGTISYDDMMSQLSDSVNRINIAIKDEYFDDAKSAIAPLKLQLQTLADNCNSCHGKDSAPVQRIMGASQELLPELEEYLQQKDRKKAGKKLGIFAVNVCARCHSIHRLTSDLKNQLE